MAIAITSNPFTNIFRRVGVTLCTIWVAMIAAGEQAGRSRAAAELARMGYYEEARKVMLQGGNSEKTN